VESIIVTIYKKGEKIYCSIYSGTSFLSSAYKSVRVCNIFSQG